MLSHTVIVYTQNRSNGGQILLKEAQSALGDSRKNRSLPADAGLTQFTFSSPTWEISKRLNTAMDSLPVNDSTVQAMASEVKAPFNAMFSMDPDHNSSVSSMIC